MSALDEGRLLDLARAIDDERPIDWHAAEDSVPNTASRAVISQLRVLHSVARVARDPDSESTAPVAADGLIDAPAPPSRAWGPLTVHELIGRGVFGTVFRAQDNLGRDVALKLFRGAADASRLLREGQLLAKLRHPNIIVVHGAGDYGGEVGVWMELIRGKTLEEELKMRGAFSADEARLIGVDLCRALAAVHEAGLVHRDVKAQNVMREQGGRIVLMDFGAGTAARVNQHDVAGTPMYLAPEVFGGQPASRLSDIYSLGVLLYHLVTGAYPLSGSSRFEIQRAHSEGRIRRLRDARPDLPEDFVRVVETALASDPRQRYQTAGELEHDLLSSRGLIPAPPPPVHWRRVGVAAALVLVAMSAAIYGVTHWFAGGAGKQSSEMTSSAAGSQPTAPAEAPYTVGVTFYRHTTAGNVRLRPGDRVRPGDALGARIESSIPVYVYVVNEDDRGECYVLFPLPGQESSNPLAAGKAHELPGMRDGEVVSWKVTSAGGREHFVVFVSPNHMTVFDGLSKTLPHPTAGRPVIYPRLPESTVTRLRGVGGLASHTPGPAASTAHYLFEGADPLGMDTDTAHGVWTRQLTLENPGS
jgi:eukaryotic-like serine/threonine-protein kinase